MSNLDENQSNKLDKNLLLESRALNFINEGKIEQAKEIYLELIDKGTKNHIVYGNLAILYGIEGSNKEMIKFLKKSLSIEPKYSLGHNNLGLAFQKDKDFLSAIESFKNAIILQPNYSEAYLRNTDLAGLEHISLKIIPLKTHYSSSNLIEKIVSAYRKETR